MAREVSRAQALDQYRSVMDAAPRRAGLRAEAWRAVATALGVEVLDGEVVLEEPDLLDAGAVDERGEPIEDAVVVADPRDALRRQAAARAYGANPAPTLGTRFDAVI